MSKRATTDSAKANPKNWWPTPPEAAEPLARILPRGTSFVEPCAGDARLADYMESQGMVCDAMLDVEPRGIDPMIERMDAREWTGYGPDVLVLTNPPFAQKLLEPLLECWIGASPAWLLLPADMLCNIWTARFMAHVSRIVPIGRVSWLDNGVGGMENYAWFRFEITPQGVIVPRRKKQKVQT